MKLGCLVILIGFIQSGLAEKLELLSNVDIFDIGLALINEDELYDIYTVNHNFAESYLLNEKHSFKLTKQLGLSQTKELPLYEPVGKSPELKVGLNIFTPNRSILLLHCNNCSNQVNGRITIPIPLKETASVAVKYQQGGTVKSSLKEEKGESFLQLDFTLEKQGLIVLEPTFPDLNYRFDINNIEVGEIFVGHAGANPKQLNFIYNTQDNHSSAWVNLDNNSSTDVFMSTGGLRGRIKDFSAKQVIAESIYSHDSTQKQYQDASNKFKFNHSKCRTYKSNWIDFDNDGDLDLYQGCLNGKNKLHIQDGLGTGQFTETAAKYALNFKQADEFKWFDYNNDNWLDLFTIDHNRLKVLTHQRKNNESKFKTQYVSKILGKKLNSVSTSIKVADVNNDGNLSIFISTGLQLHVFDSQTDGTIKPVPLSELKLPEVLTGHVTFADVDFDGTLDLINFDSGIFINKKNQFMLSKTWPELFVKKKHHFKNQIWFDTDINGQWDVLIAASYPTGSKNNKTILDYQYRDMKVRDHLEVIRNIPNNNNWLYIDLVGSQFNQSAIGAKVQIKSPGQVQIRQVMGTEDSYHSQGHYRQYFGIGKNEFTDITVTWPNGKVQKLNHVPANQLIKIQYQN